MMPPSPPPSSRHSRLLSSPQTLDGGSEGEGSLRADDADGLEDGLAAVATEDGRVVDPLKAALELAIQSSHRGGIDAGA
jgi:hypothetical protein